MTNLQCQRDILAERGGPAGHGLRSVCSNSRCTVIVLTLTDLRHTRGGLMVFH